ncbi:MAG: hypothetical protein ACRCT8_07565 [Lacipirellulaceae bacterium]
MRHPLTRIAGLALALSFVALSAQAALINLTPQGVASNSNVSVKLSDLLSGEVMGIKVGDKDFTGFSYSTIGDMPAAPDVNVLGFRDPDGNWGISLHGGFLDLPGGAPLSDAKVRFTVSVDDVGLRQGYLINDAHLFVNGAGIGPNSFFAVDETFLGQPNVSLNAFKTTLNGSSETQLQDWVDFLQPVRSLVVTKDILAIAGQGSNQPARATVIDQSFSQVLIPEPTAAVLGLLAVAGASRRRR